MADTTGGQQLGEFVSANIQHGIQKGCRDESLFDALRRALKKQYPVVDGDPGYHHRLTLATLALGKDSACKSKLLLFMGAPASRDLSRFECDRTVIDGCALGNGVGYQKLSDEQVMVQFTPAPVAAGKKILVPVRGSFKLAVNYDGDALGCATEAQGVYVLEEYPIGGQYMMLRLPLQKQKHVSHCVKHQLPLHELRVQFKRVSETHVKIANVKLVLLLRPQPHWLLEKRSCIPVGTRRCPVEPAPLSHSYCSEEERRECEPASVPSGVAAILDSLVQSRLSSSVAHTYRLVANIGPKQLCAIGAGEQHYRFGSCSEPISAIAVIAYVQENAPKTWRIVDLHDHRVLEYFLAKNGAQNILAGLKQMYESHGHRIPSLFELLNHCSGLPEHFALGESSELVRSLESCGKDGLADTDSLIDPRVREESIGKMLAKHCRPLFAPGCKYHHSHLGYSLLRYVFADWHQGRSHAHIERSAAELGAPSVHYSEDVNLRMASQCPTSNGLIEDSLQADNYNLSCGMKARVDEVAVMLSERNPWRQGSSKKKEKYGFLVHTLLPRVVIHRNASIYAGYGWDHVAVSLPGYPKTGVRVLLKVGHTRGHHTTLMLLVPALGLSLVLGTNADISCFAEGKGGKSVLNFVQQLLSSIVSQLSGLENCHMRPALLFNRECNAQLSIAPSCTPHYPVYRRYCAGKERVQDSSGNLCALNGKTLYSLLDIRHSIATLDAFVAQNRSPTTEAPVLLKIQKDGEVWSLTEQTLYGDSVTHTLGYDPGAYRNSEDAARSLASNRKGGALDTRGCGSHRLVDPLDGLLTEFVDIQANQVYLRGRLYVLPETYERIRVLVAPTLMDKITRNSEEIATARAEDFSYAQVLSVESSITDAPATDLVGRRHGGGRRGGGGFARGFGRGLATSAGLGLGLATGAALGYGYPWYGYGYPYYYDPYYYYYRPVVY